MTVSCLEQRFSYSLRCLPYLTLYCQVNFYVGNCLFCVLCSICYKMLRWVKLNIFVKLFVVKSSTFISFISLLQLKMNKQMNRGKFFKPYITIFILFLLCLTGVSHRRLIDFSRSYHCHPYINRLSQGGFDKRWSAIRPGMFMTCKCTLVCLSHTHLLVFLVDYFIVCVAVYSPRNVVYNL